MPVLRKLTAACTAIAVAAAMLVVVAALGSVAPAQAIPQTREPTAERPSAPAARKAHVNWGQRRFAPGTPLTVKGRLPGGKRVVRLQVQIPHQWRTLRSKRTSKNGKFRLSAKLDWYGKHKVRVLAPGRPVVVKTKKVMVVKPYEPRGSKRDFKLLKARGNNFTFNPCQTMRYKVNADDVGANGVEMAKLAMLQMSWATGIKVKYTGTTHVIPYQKRRTKLPRRTNLVIAWADSNEVPLLAQKQASGLGGPLQGRLGRNARGKRVWLTHAAAVVLDTYYYYNGAAPTFFSPTWNTGQVLIHEIGHAVGLAHVPKAPEEIMYPSVGPPYPDGLYKGVYSLGDLKGLTKVGLNQGCVSPARGGRVGARFSFPTPLP